MNAKFWMVALLAIAVLPIRSVEGAADPGVAGKWSTDAGKFFSKRKDAEIDASVRDVPIVDAAGGLRGNNNRGGFNNGRGGGIPNMGRGGQSGLGNNGTFGANNGFGNNTRGNTGAGAFGNTARGNNGLGNNGAFGNMSRGNNGAFGSNGLGNNGPFANNGFGNNGLGPGGFGAGGRGLGALSAPEGPAFELELKVDKKNKVTGSLTAYSYDGGVQEEKMKIEDGLLTGNTFTFSTTHKANGIKFPYKWKGEQTAANTIRLTFLSAPGEAADEGSIVFRREQ